MSLTLQPAAVVILAGTNDIAGNTGPMSLEEIEGNYMSLAEIGAAHHVRVIFSSVLPVHNYTPKVGEFFCPALACEKILELNRWLREYCASNGCVYLDYFSADGRSDGTVEEGISRRRPASQSRWLCHHGASGRSCDPEGAGYAVNKFSFLCRNPPPGIIMGGDVTTPREDAPVWRLAGLDPNPG